MGVAVVNGRRFFGFVVFATLLFPAHAIAQIWYVDKDNAGGMEDGKTWSTAFGDIQPAIDAAYIYGGQVWVAEGVYDEIRSAAIGAYPPEPNHNRATSLVTRSVALYGGFTGTETLRGQADPTAHPTIIDGSKAAGGQPDDVTVFGSNLDGFTIRGGGGVAIDVRAGNSRSTFLRRLVIEDYPVAAVTGTGAVGVVEECVFRGNGGPATPEGGVFAGHSYPIVMRNCLIEGNYGVSRRADPVAGAKQLTENCVFRGNVAVDSAPLIWVRGGSDPYGRDSVVRNCVFMDNEATTLLATETATIWFEQTLIARNSFEIGIEIACKSPPRLVQCTIADNSIAQGGAACRVTLVSGGALGDYCMHIHNSILWNPPAAPEVLARSRDPYNHAVFYPLGQSPWIEGTIINGQTALPAPSFVDPAGDDYRLAAGSSGIDIGEAWVVATLLVDLGGAWRIQGLTVDAGVFESAGDTLDSDGDGIPDAAEGAPDRDTDLDGVYDYLDTDADGDGILDSAEGITDIDHDEIPNFQDSDSDDDGVADGVEVALGANPYDRDSDGDGIGDNVEDLLANRDTDGDGTPDALDDDSDGDGWSDAYEGVASLELHWVERTPGDLKNGVELVIAREAIPNYRDLDSDNDGVSDADERVNGTFPYDPDFDGDGVPDYAEVIGAGRTSLFFPDTDDDGDPDLDDNDSDNDGIPDSVETGNDSDGDGIPNFRDLDSDNDGVSDSDEWLAGTNPYGSKMAADVDGSKAVDAVDIQIIINRVLGLNAKHCDVNNDKSVDATDIQWCINAVLGLIG